MESSGTDRAERKGLKIQLADSVIAKAMMKRMVLTPWTRRIVNKAYGRLTPSQRRQFHFLYSRLFRDASAHRIDGYWRVDFVGRSIRMPLSSQELWLDWDTAVSITAHDLEVKETYAGLISSKQPPSQFVDIGANYGTHSLIFLVHGIPTLTFEPNPSCHGYFNRLCKMNGVSASLQAVALGEREGSVTLTYPEAETWHGSIDAAVAAELASRGAVKSETVKVLTLDHYLDQFPTQGLVIKIDTEGHELGVLRGASRTLESVNPVVLFESVRKEDRPEIFDTFAAHSYQLRLLPWFADRTSESIERSAFLSSSNTNFVAVPRVNAL